MQFRNFRTNLFSEQWIGGSGPKARRTHYPDLNPLYFYLWRYLTSTFFGYGIQLRPGLAIAKTEWICGDTYDTWNLPASQAVTVQKWDVLY